MCNQILSPFIVCEKSLNHVPLNAFSCGHARKSRQLEDEVGNKSFTRRTNFKQVQGSVDRPLNLCTQRFARMSTPPQKTDKIAISTFDCKVVWINGPFPAGKSDIRIFQNDGLKDKIREGKRAITDSLYVGEAGTCSIPYNGDEPALQNFKGRARLRHESFNGGRIKNFQCLAETFRHGVEKHKIAFEAVCTIVQYQMDNGARLFDV